MNELEQRIHAEIAEKGGIPFSRFMEMALYEPGLGYYETHREIGRKGDFYTNVSVGSLFGELLGFQIANWLQEIEGNVQLVEAGAHDGRLARDILYYLREYRPAIFERCELQLWEASEIHREWQEEVLIEFSGKVRWMRQGQKFRGVFYCNELFDALPVERYVWNKEQGNWNLCVVQSVEGVFTWDVLRSIDQRNPDPFEIFPSEQMAQVVSELPDGFVVICAEPEMWLRACENLSEGRMVVIDYWTDVEQILSPRSAKGNLRGYYNHHIIENVLERPGQIDITSSVNGTEIVRWAEEEGVQCTPLSRQAKFLVKILDETLKRPELFPEWTPERTRQFQTLVHPEHLGHSFKVLECRRP